MTRVLIELRIFALRCLAVATLSLAVSCGPTGPTAPATQPLAHLPLAHSSGELPNGAAASTQPVIPVAECRWTDQPITIDGKADKAAWQHAQLVDNFQISWASGPARKPHTTTKAKLLWDREYLYFLAEMQDTDLYADVTEHNGTTWLNDVFEVFFKPADDKPGYYEFEVSPANTTMELFIPARGSGGYERYRHTTHIKMETAVALRGTLNQWQDTDEGWTVEGRIPWRDLAATGGRPNVDEQWKFALCRGDYSVGIDGPELTSSAPLTAMNFHKWEDYAPIRFVGPQSPAGPATQQSDSTTSPVATAPPTTGPATTATATTGPATTGLATTVPAALGNFDPQHRVLWTTSHVAGSPDTALPFTVAKAWPKFKVKQPLYLLEEPGTDNLLLLQHLGNWAGPSRLLRLKNASDVDHADVLLDQDRLSMGMALHPDFVHNGYLYIMSNGPVSATNKQDRISRFTISRTAPYQIDLKSELVILEWDSNGHNGGDLGFGPDGYLYHASGDGSTDSDADLRGQDITHLNSVMIRIDVDHPDKDKPYSIPKDNPFLQTPGARPEIWAYGFRNPWRLAFDRFNGQLWVGQNGQDLLEQVYLVRRGENYGWSIYEGSQPFNLNRKRGSTPITPPTVEHSHGEMRSLTGGVVYYGSKFPELKGCFIYGDWSTGRIWAVRHDGTKVTLHKELARTTLQIAGFREMSSGDLIVIDQGGGLYTLERTPGEQSTPPFPTRLSETGLFTSTSENLPAAGLIPYSVNSPLWSDGAAKERFIALPGEATTDMTTWHGWLFPEKTVLVKTFSLDTPVAREPGKTIHRRIETRLFTKQLGQWAGYSYVWNDEQTDATLVAAAGEERAYTVVDAKAPGGTRQQTWHYPSRTECMVCHSRASNFVLGLTTLQLNKVVAFNGVKLNQLAMFEQLGILHVDYMGQVRDAFRAKLIADGKTDKEADAATSEQFATRLQREPKPSTLLALPPEKLVRQPDPYDPKDGSLANRARSYLASNCAICHVSAGGGNSLIDLDYLTSPGKMVAFDIVPQHETYGIKSPRLIAMGNPEQSVLLHRVAIRGPGQMPPLATKLIDKQAVKLLSDWIAEMSPPATQPAQAAAVSSASHVQP